MDRTFPDVVNSREVTQKEWDYLWSNIDKTNILQSWEYGEAKSKAEGWKPIRLVFEDDKKIIVGLAQVLTKTLPFVGGLARLNRGPLLVRAGDEEEIGLNKLQLINHIRKVAKTRWWWLFYLAPEIEEWNGKTN